MFVAVFLAMAFKDVLRCFYERAKAADPTLTQEKYAKRHQMHRTELSQMLSGSYVPTAKLIGQIFKTEGYELQDCIELPEMRAEREAHVRIIEDFVQHSEALKELLREYVEFVNWKRDRRKIELVERPTEARSPPGAVRKQRRVI